ATGYTVTGTGTMFMQHTDPIFAQDIVKDVSVYGGNNGAITLNPVCGGQPQYTFQWSNGNTTQNLSNISAGVYTVTIVDGIGCTATLTVPVSQPGPTGMKVEVVSAPKLGCNTSDCAKFQVLALPNHIYQWSSNIPNLAGFFGANPEICYAGMYTVVVTNVATGATASKTIRVDRKEYTGPQVQLQSSNPAFCNNGSGGCELVCPGSTVTYTAGPSSSNCGPVAFQWLVTGAKNYTVAPNGGSVTVTWDDPGGGQVKAFGSDLFQCLYPTTRCVTVQEEPVSSFSSSLPPAPDGVLRLCKGQTVFFKNTSQNATRFEWLFTDDQSTALSEHAEHTFATPGLFQVLQIARSQCFCADSSWLDVEVLDTETPLVECVSTICPGETVTYSTASGCAPYAWTVSSNGAIVAGGGANDNTVTVQWLSGPDGLIELQAPNCGSSACPEAAQLHVPVLSNQANIEGPDRLCPGSEARYSMPAFEGTSYSWKIIGAGQILDGQGTREVNVRWNTASSSVYRLIVHYENCYLGCSGDDTLQVYVRGPLSLNGPLEACAGATGKVLTAAPSGVQSNWTLYGPGGAPVWQSAGASNTSEPVYSAGPGLYRLVAVPDAASWLNTCSDSAQLRIQVAPLPPKPSGIDGPAVFCPGQSLVFQANGVHPANQVRWQIKNSNGPPQEKPGNPAIATFTDGNPRWVAARQVSSDGLGCLSDSAQLSLQALQSLPISGPAGLCSGSISNFSAPAYPDLHYQWSVLPADAGVLHTGQGSPAIEVFWPRPGTYTIELTVCGKTSSRQVTVWNNPQPQPDFPAGLCAGSNGLATSGGGFASYRWKNESGATIGQSQDLPLGPGNYALVVTDNNGCAGTAEFAIAEYPLPNLTITTTDPTGFCDNSRTVTMSALTTADGDYQYEWFRDGMPLGIDAPVFSTSKYGLYSARVTNQYGCTATDGTIRVFEYCSGVCHNPNHVPCPAGAIDIGIEPLAQCNQFQFRTLANPGSFVPGSTVWHFGESGSEYLGSST
ncbi:MAG: SprB repeat-containing protein, partial [Saprospiraceae bacterium]|nr:SprB repeat-containing protein [Saprospiraceae bacterium]